MAVDLLKPVLSNRTRSINFFNGRLLAGEDLTNEQQTNRAAHALLGQAIGDGVVYGLEVKESSQSSKPQSPVLAVTRGLAVNKNGGSLLLDTDTEVALVRPANGTNASTGSSAIFQECTPTQTGAYIAGAGVYLLTIGPANAPQGLAEVSGISTAQAPCNSKYNAQGVQFRLIPIIGFTKDELNDTNHLRNLVAYRCFGVADQTTVIADPFGPQVASYGLLDQLRSNSILTNCEVPLAVLYWTADSGIVFVDMWAVRRRATHGPVTSVWPLLAGDRRVSEAEAEFSQFEDQMQSILVNENNPASITVDSHFEFLPAAGMLPTVGKGSVSGFDANTFFGAHASRDIATTDGDLLRELFHDALYQEPVRLSTTRKIQLYLIWENLQAVSQGISHQLALIFASPALRYRGIARFGFAKSSLGRFAPRVI